MKKSSDKIRWEDAIVRVVEECGGSATLKELGRLRRIALGIYALPDKKLEQTLFDEIQGGTAKEEIFKGISNKDLHSYVEGMLLELGNIYCYLTYTADPSGMFSGKPLGKIATIENFPSFTSLPLLDIAETIDVIWFKKRALVPMPKHTFYVVSPIKKVQQFRKKLVTDPYEEIGDRFFFRSVEDIFLLYEVAIRHSELKERIIIEPL